MIQTRNRWLITNGILITIMSCLLANPIPSTPITATLDTLAKQHEAILTTISNPELHNQHPLTAYLQGMEQNTQTLLTFITTTNQEAFAYCLSRLAASINTIATTTDQLAVDLLLHYGISHPNQIAQDLFEALIVYALATLLVSTPQPSNDQCEQTVQTIHQSLQTCATILVQNLPLLHQEPVEQSTLKKRLLTIAWYVGIIGVSIGASYLLYQYVIKPFWQEHQNLKDQVAVLQEQQKITDQDVKRLNQALEQAAKEQVAFQEQQNKLREQQQQQQPKLDQQPKQQQPQLDQQKQPVVDDAARRNFDRRVVEALENQHAHIVALEQTQHRNQDCWQNTVKGITQELNEKETAPKEAMTFLQGAFKDLQKPTPAQVAVGIANDNKHETDRIDQVLSERLEKLKS